jgi:hypothetical protein
VLVAAIVLQDVNKDPGAEDTFKQIGEAYEVGAAALAEWCMVQQWKLQQRFGGHTTAWQHVVWYLRHDACRTAVHFWVKSSSRGLVGQPALTAPTIIGNGLRFML